ncbi:ATP-binding response regulator [Saccharothrix algeriensis]|uniref:histidine kinase n=1 Tax=Saccharothrix algeriensis TaxID=173560 RepID=A0A8T8HZT3_9PSEU|nr:ATP-binding protein [Saccharothrix algeriensis]MBM7809917.1 signal transduction histidine kinase [Saccharothrix algeriensis]QTR04163.1 response regulator [Saccharothrix algeriensis]
MTAGGAPEELLRVVIADEPGVFRVRQRGRQVAAALGLDGQDQVRVATALSDVGRDLVRQGASATVVFRLRREPRPALLVELSWQGAVSTDSGPGWDTARRLMDEVHTAGAATTLVKAAQPGAAALAPDRVADLRRRLGDADGGTALDELRAQNQELLETLETLEHKSRELERLNEELEDTNRGVVALYQELSDELEQTNQGVVALYAELDAKSAELREAAAARIRFWSNISHELRAPINSVVGLTRLLGAPGGDPMTDGQRQHVQLINESAATLLALVNELLDTAKAESGSLRPRPAPVALDYVVVQLRAALQPVLRSGDVRLVVDPLPELPPLVTDETMLVRVLRNVLSNAVKFTTEGEVRLSVRPDREQGEIRLVVTDTGIGIPADEQRKVFEEFYQVPSALQVGAGGTGLGLPYARRLAEILGGTLTLTSEPGVGTEVVFTLPVGTADDTPPAPVARALIADEDAAARGRLRAALGDLVAEVVEAGDGRGALAEAKDRRPDLVFLDASTPLMSGSAVLSVLRLDPVLEGTPVVVVCGDDPGGLARTVTGLGAALLHHSRISPESVRRAVRDAQFAARRTKSR